MSAPKLSPQAQRKRYDYNNSYRSNYFKSKCVSFNTKFPEDIALYEWLKNQPENGNQYIKRLIREDMERRQKENV